MCVLIGTDVLPKLGFVLLESDADGIATDCLSKQKWKRECESTEHSPTYLPIMDMTIAHLELSNSLPPRESLLDMYE